MKVKFKREGGFAGMSVLREAEQNDLPQDARLALERLKTVESASPRDKGARRDGFVYTIEYEYADAPVVVALDEKDVTSELAPLIQFFESSI